MHSVKPQVRSAPAAPLGAVTVLLVITSLLSLAIPVAVAIEFNPLWWISAAMTLVLLVSGLLLSLEEDQRLVGRLLLVGASTANVIELNFWAGPDNYLAQVGFLGLWLAAPPLVLAFLVYPTDTVEPRVRRFYRCAWIWAVVPRLLAALTRGDHETQVSGVGWWAPFDLPAFSDALLWTEAIASIGVAAWGTCEFVRRWRRARGTAATLIRILSAGGIAMVWGVVAREIGWVLFGADLLPRAVWDRIGDVHQLVIVAAICTVGFSVFRSFARRGRLIERMVATAGDAQALEEALRDELRDPSIALYFRVEDGWRTAAGAPTVPPGGADRDIVELLVEDTAPRALVSLDGEDRLDPVRRRVALAAAGMVLHAASVAIERDAYVSELAASRTRIAAEAESQRRRLERMLHDGVQQSLLAATATLSRAKLARRSGDAEAVESSIEEAHRQLLDALAELRSLARGIYPAALAESGLVGGVENLAARWPTVTLEVEPPEDAYVDLPPDRASLLYFAIAEGLNNAHKYGTPPVTVSLRQDAGTVTVEVVDSGPGGARLLPGGGIEGLRDRAAGLGGSVRVVSPAEGPTSLTVTLPRS